VFQLRDNMLPINFLQIGHLRLMSTLHGALRCAPTAPVSYRHSNTTMLMLDGLNLILTTDEADRLVGWHLGVSL